MECRIINDYKAYSKKHPKSVPIKMIFQEGLMSSLACPLTLNNQGMGAIIFSSKQPDCYSENHVPMAKLIANCMAISLEKNLLMNNRLLSSIAQFARLVESKKNAAGFHIERIQNYSRIIAETLAGKKKYINIIDRQFIEDIYTFSPLHDIGKIGIADGILLKPGKLTAEEFEIIKQHTVIGTELLRKATDTLSQNGMTYFDMAIQIAESHHEKYDGSGYPFGLAGDDIPLSARIVAVADVFGALTSKRVYRSAYDIEASMQIIDKESGISFDPDIVDTLNENIEQIVKMYKRYQENIDVDRR